MSAALLLFCVTASSQTPSAPPLVPIEQSQAEDTERYQPAPAPVPAPPYEAAEVQPTSTRGKRLAATIVGTLVGDAVVAGLWMLQVGFLGASNETLGVISVLTIAGLAPFGTLIGNRIGGGNAPYWKVLLGTLAGAAVSGIFVGLLAYSGALSRDTGVAVAGVAGSALPFMAAQVLSTEVGAED